MSSNIPPVYVNTYIHISCKQIHIFFQILRCFKMFKEEGNEEIVILRRPKCEYDPQKGEHQTFEMAQKSSEDSSNVSGDVQEKPTDLEHIARDMLKLLPQYGRNQGQGRKVGVKSKKYACQNCNYRTSQNGHLKRHWTAKHTQERFKCVLCGSSFTIANTLSRHVANKHRGVTFKCAVEDCSYIATRKWKLKEHTLRVHFNVAVRCKKCGIKFEKSHLLKKHIALKHNGRMLHCPKCDYSNWEMSNMRRHMEVNHDGVRYKCKICNKIYTKNSTLTKHMSKSHLTCDLKPAC